MAAVNAVRCVRLLKLSNPTPMRASVRLAAIVCALALCLAPVRTQSQATSEAAPAETQITGQVVDQSGAVIPGAEVHDAVTGKLLGKTDASGHLMLNCAAPCAVRIVARGFTSTETEWQPAKPITLPIDPKYLGFDQVIEHTVTVTAYRTPLGELESPVSTRTLS